MNQKR